MSRLAPQHHLDPHVLDDKVTDRTVKIARCSVATNNAVRHARNFSDVLSHNGAPCSRVLLVFVDDFTHAERLSCVVFAVGSKSIVAAVDDCGRFVSRTVYDVNTSKRAPIEFLYHVTGYRYDNPCTTNEKYGGVRINARNICCYK